MLSYATFSSNELHFLVVTNSLLIFFFSRRQQIFKNLFECGLDLPVFNSLLQFINKGGVKMNLPKCDYHYILLFPHIIHGKMKGELLET